MYDGRSQSVEALTCHGSDSAVLSTLLGCAGYLEESATRVGGSERYGGRQAIVIVTEGTSRGEDERLDFTDRLYVDARTWLPLAIETTGTFDYGPRASYKARDLFEHEFVAADSLAADFFEPASIGYVEPDPRRG